MAIRILINDYSFIKGRVSVIKNKSKNKSKKKKKKKKTDPICALFKLFLDNNKEPTGTSTNTNE